MSPVDKGNVSSFVLKIGTLGLDFRVRSIFGRESVCSLFKYKIVFGVADPDLNPAEVLNKPVSLSIVVPEGNEDSHHPDDDNVARYFNGICTRFEHQSDGIDLSYYEIVVRPLVWRLTQRKNCRIFQQKRTADIIADILSDAGVPGDRFDFKLDSTFYKIRDYSVQYMMTDWDYIQLLIEEEGIYYYFNQKKMGDILIFGDRSEGYDFIVGDRAIPFYEPSGMFRTGDHVRDFKLKHEVRSGKYTMRDMEFTKPVPAIEGSTPAKINAELEIYEYPGTYVSSDKRETALAKSITERRLDALQATIVKGSGISNCRRFVTGSTFKLTEHPTDSRNIEYMILSMDIEGVQPQAGDREASADPDEAKQLFVAEFTCIPHKTVFRPMPSVEKSRIYGTQTAIVVGPSGEEIYTDEHGRVKVQFHWDKKGAFDDHASCWIRVNQNSAGNEYGSILIPRIGWEVIVAFMEGDPDRPVIVGNLYNGDHKPPYPLPDNKNISGIKTNSSIDGDGANEFTMDDTAGSEKIFLHAQKDFHQRVLNDSVVAIENDAHQLVMNDANTQIDGNHSIKINLDELLDIGGKQSLKIGGDQHVEIGGSEQKKVGMNYHLKSGMQIVLETGMMLSLKAGSGQIVLDATGVTIKGSLVTIDGSLVKINSGPGSPAGSPTAPQTDAPTAPLEPDTVKVGSDVAYSQAASQSAKSAASTDSPAGSVKVSQSKAVATPGSPQSKSGGGAGSSSSQSKGGAGSPGQSKGGGSGAGQSKAGGGLGDGISDQTKGAGLDQAEQAKNAGLDKANQAKGAGLDQAEQAKNAGLDKANQAKSAGLDQAEQAKNAGLDKANQAKNAGLDQAEQTKNAGLDKANQAKNTGLDQAEQAKNAAMDQAEEAKGLPPNPNQDKLGF